VRGTRVWARLVELRGTVVEDVWVGNEGVVVAVVATRPKGAGARSLRGLPAPVAGV
jgi:hypothetical protein